MSQATETRVPFMELAAQYRTIREDILREVHDVLDRAAYISGPKVRRFEEAFAKAQGAAHCAGLSSGTDALHVALWALGVGHGDEVIVPVNTFIATAACVTLTGAKVVFVDQDEHTFNMDPARLEAAITPRTKAIIPVHLYGRPVAMDAILAVAAKHGLLVVEDCAQAHLAEWRGKRVGTFGAIGAFSFYPGKNLGAYGEAGAVVTNDQALHERVLRLRDHGSAVKYVHEMEGHNYRMEELQGGVLWVKLQHLEAWTEARRRAADRYRALLAGIPGLTTPSDEPEGRHVYHLFVVRAARRDDLMAHLKQAGIQFGLHYPIPLHLQQAYAYLGHARGDFPVAERCCAEILSLPIYPELTEGSQQYVAETIRSFYRR